MAKTNRELRSDFAKEMRDKRKEKNEQLEQVENSKFSQWLKEQMSKEIKENFEKEIDEIKSRPWYSEARESHLQEIKAKMWVKKAKTAKENLLKEYEEKLAKADAEISDAENSYNEAQVAHRWKVEDEEKSSDWKESLRWDTDAILRDLKENHVKIEENAKMMWYKWRKVHIELPAVWNFEWFKFNYFVSNDYVTKWNFEKKSELEEKSYSMSDVSKLLQAMNKYMIELGGKNDGDMDYENKLKFWETETYRCEAWDCLKAITWLDVWYWMKDKDVAGRQNSRANWGCRDYDCGFSRTAYDDFANLFLRLSD